MEARLLCRFVMEEAWVLAGSVVERCRLPMAFWQIMQNLKSLFLLRRVLEIVGRFKMKQDVGLVILKHLSHKLYVHVLKVDLL